jgi:hypothetical protein
MPYLQGNSQSNARKNHGMTIPKRTRQEIDIEYSTCAAQAGDLSFKLEAAKNEHDRLLAQRLGLFKRMDQLNAEATELNKYSQEPEKHQSSQAPILVEEGAS